MPIAIIGGGLSGLALSYFFLRQGAEVLLLDEGKGASRAACGLMHPYAGERGSFSLHAHEALQEALALIEAASPFSKSPLILARGLVKTATNPLMLQNLKKAVLEQGDITLLEKGDFYIKEGICLDTPRYLEALLSLCKSQNGFWYKKTTVTTLNALSSMDAIVLACGYGIKALVPPTLYPLRFTKGQALTFKGISPSTRIAKGYVAPSSDPRYWVLGATYEKHFVDEEADQRLAETLLLPRLQAYFPEVVLEEIIECKSGVRVSVREKSHPLIGCIQNRLYVMTAMGSKGILYHAFLAKMLVEAILSRAALPASYDINKVKI